MIHKRKIVTILACLLIILGCSKSGKKRWVIQEPSEMSNLMNEMYAYNESIKQQVLGGNVSNNFPERFNAIHKAVLTRPATRDSLFENLSAQFIESQMALYHAPTEELVSTFNGAINSCIDCHQVKCTGPIPRIQKLLITEDEYRTPNKE